MLCANEGELTRVYNTFTYIHTQREGEKRRERGKEETRGGKEQMNLNSICSAGNTGQYAGQSINFSTAILISTKFYAIKDRRSQSPFLH